MNCNRAIQGVYAITDPFLLPDNIIYDQVSKAIDAGISVLQYRNKIAAYAIQQQQAEKLNDLCRKNQVLFIINDSIKLAKHVSADGVHLGKEDNNISYARSELGSNSIIGLSCYNKLQRAVDAQLQGADYIAFGRFFPSKTKPQAIAADLELIIQAKQKLSIPIVAIGGITIDNAASLINAGADSIAVINGIFGQTDIFNTVQGLAKSFNPA
jgi:thiamine-phosphate pyrophosphorylase